MKERLIEKNETLSTESKNIYTKYNLKERLLKDFINKQKICNYLWIISVVILILPVIILFGETK